MHTMVRLFLVIALVSNPVHAADNKTMSKTSSVVKWCAVYLVGIATGFGLKEYIAYVYNVPKDTTLADKIMLGKHVAAEIEKRGNNPVAYTAEYLADGKIGTIEHNDETDYTVRVKKFFLQRKGEYDRIYTEEELQAPRRLLELVERNFEAYNEYAKTVGKVPYGIVPGYEIIEGKKLLLSIGIKKSIKRND